MHAAEKGHTGCVRVLIEVGADKEVRDEVRHLHIDLFVRRNGAGVFLFL